MVLNQVNIQWNKKKFYFISLACYLISHFFVFLIWTIDHYLAQKNLLLKMIWWFLIVIFGELILGLPFILSNYNQYKIKPLGLIYTKSLSGKFSKKIFIGLF